MLTGFVMCVPIKSKSADEVVTAYTNHITYIFDPSCKILSNNGTEFKNKLFEEVAPCWAQSIKPRYHCTCLNQMVELKDFTNFSKHVSPSTSPLKLSTAKSHTWPVQLTTGCQMRFQVSLLSDVWL